MKRMWINQDSTSQRLHKLHGTNVLLDESNKTIYFLSGDVVSMMPPDEALSEGWTDENKHCLDFVKSVADLTDSDIEIVLAGNVKTTLDSLLYNAKKILKDLK